MTWRLSASHCPSLPRLQASLQPVVTDVLSALAARTQGRNTGSTRSRGLIDLLLFNPPYVPTTQEEEAAAQKDAALSGSWAGGSTGTKLLDQLIDDVGGRGHGGVEVSGQECLYNACTAQGSS